MIDVILCVTFRIKLLFKCLNRTALHIAVMEENIEIIKALLSNPNIDVNIYLISNRKYFLM